MSFLIQLPYVQVWLPLVAALVVALPIVWLVRARRPSSAPPVEQAFLKLQTASPDGLDPFVHGSRNEKRKAARRHGSVIKLQVALASSPEAEFVGYTVDRSTSGLRLLLPSPHELGTILTVRPAKAPADTPWVQVEVRSCAPSSIEPHEFEAGCQFVRSPSYATLAMFG